MNLKRLIQYGILAVLIVFLFAGGPQIFDTRSLKKVWDLGHIVLFGLLFTIILKDSKWLRQKKLYSQLTIILLFTFIFGIIIEWIQLFIGRTSELIDVLRNAIGTLLAFVFSENIKILKKNTIRIARIIVLILLLIVLWPLTKVVTDEVQAQINFPVIADFEESFEIEKWYGKSLISLEKNVVKNGDYSLKAVLLTKKYSGISISYFPSNWENYNKLKFDVYSESKIPLQLTCRLHDKQHNNQFNDRFNKSIVVGQGWNEIEIYLDEIINAPQDRKMDITNMKNFALFAVKLKERHTIYFDYLRLEQ